MYRVITMSGYDEPWWFFEDWQKDIQSVDEYEDFYQALKKYKSEWLKMAKSYKEFKSQDDLLASGEVEMRSGVKNAQDISNAIKV